MSNSTHFFRAKQNEGRQSQQNNTQKMDEDSHDKKQKKRILKEKEKHKQSIFLKVRACGACRQLQALRPPQRKLVPLLVVIRQLLQGKKLRVIDRVRVRARIYLCVRISVILVCERFCGRECELLINKIV